MTYTTYPYYHVKNINGVQFYKGLSKKSLRSISMEPYLGLYKLDETKNKIIQKIM